MNLQNSNCSLSSSSTSASSTSSIVVPSSSSSSFSLSSSGSSSLSSINDWNELITKEKYFIIYDFLVNKEKPLKKPIPLSIVVKILYFVWQTQDWFPHNTDTGHTNNGNDTIDHSNSSAFQSPLISPNKAP